MRKKSLIDRVKKVQCQQMIVREENDLFCKLPLKMDWYRIEMYNRLIEELRRNGIIEETIEDTPDYKVIKMKLLVLEPEEFTDDEDEIN